MVRLARNARQSIWIGWVLGLATSLASSANGDSSIPQALETWRPIVFSDQAGNVGDRQELVLALEERGVEYGVQRLAVPNRQKSRPEVQLSVSVDWEGASLDEPNLKAIRTFRNRHPEVKLTHFLNAEYFTKVGADAEAIRTQIASVLRDGDEVGLHIHGWRSLFEAAGVPYRSSRTWTGRAPIMFGGDTGHEVPISEYSVDELRKVIRHSLETLAKNGFGSIRTFRAGGWMAAPNVLQALAAEGIQIDSSALPTNLRTTPLNLSPELRRMTRETWPQVHVATQPYRIATSAGEVMEFPNGAGMVDYVSGDDAEEMLKANLRMRDKASSTPLWHFSIGFHQETAADYLDRLEQGLWKIERALRTQGLRYGYGTLSEAAALSSPIPAEPWPPAPLEPTKVECFRAKVKGLLEGILGQQRHR